MTAVDDLHVNNWIAVTSWEDEFGISLFGTPVSRSRPVDGAPLQIRAISLPFICVSDGTYRYALDMRKCVVKKLHPKYVKMMMRNGHGAAHGCGYVTKDGQPVVSLADWCGNDNKVIDSDQRKIKSADPQKRVCPICGCPLVERLIQEDRSWVLFCKECNFRGSIPRDGEGTEG